MKKIALVGIMITVLLLSACASKAATGTSVDRNSLSYDQAGAAPAVAPVAESKGVDVQAVGNASSTTTEQLVIKNANLSIVVLKADVAVQSINIIASKYGGYVVTSNLYKTVAGTDTTVTQGYITIRVKAENLDAALAEIHALTPDPKNDVTSENVSGEDITATVVDLESQLTSYEAAAAKLNQFLDKAESTEDTLNVFNQLLSIQQQVEVLKGQIKYYRESARLSSVTVNITEKVTVAPVTSAGWKPLQVLRDAAQALVKALQVLVDILIFIIIFLGPFILVAIFIIWLVWRSKKKHGWTRKGLRWYPPQPVPPSIPK